MFARAAANKFRVVVGITVAAAAATRRRPTECRFDCNAYTLWVVGYPPPGLTFDQVIAAGDVDTLQKCADAQNWGKNWDGVFLEQFWFTNCRANDQSEELVPTRIAVQNGHLEMLKLLHAHGCELEKSTIVQVALDHDELRIAEWLLGPGGCDWPADMIHDADASYIRAQIQGPKSALALLGDRGGLKPRTYYAAAVQTSMRKDCDVIEEEIVERPARKQ